MKRETFPRSSLLAARSLKIRRTAAKKHCVHAFLLSLIAFSLPPSAHAQSGLRLLNADSVRGLEENGVSITEAVGNVHLAQDSADMTCDRARLIQAQSRTEFYGNVKMREGKKWLHADQVISYDDRRIRIASGNAALGDHSSQLTARQVTYFQNDERALAEHDVAISNSERRVLLTCGRAEYLRDREYSRATLAPVLIEFDSVQTEKLRITGNMIELFEGGARAKVSGKVEITRQNTRAQCDTAEYFRTEGRLQLRAQPVAWQKRDELRGELIEMFLHDQKLTHALVTGKAVMTSPVDSTGKDHRQNSLSGGKMTLHFQNEELEHVVVEETATSVYHVLEQGKEQGVNHVQGDHITLFIAAGELQRILIASEPGTSTGKYEPAGMSTPAPASGPRP